MSLSMVRSISPTSSHEHPATIRRRQNDVTACIGPAQIVAPRSCHRENAATSRRVVAGTGTGNGAHAHAFPSVAEGVGLPVLEALACATPTVTTTHPALQEAGLGLATHVPPDDPRALRHALAHTLQDPTLRPHLTHAAPPLLRPHTLCTHATTQPHKPYH